MMKKNRFCLILIAIVLCLIGTVFSACSRDDKSEKNDVILTYYLYDGVAPITTKVIDGTFTFVRLPQREHYEFLGLFDAKEGGTRLIDNTGVCTIRIDRSMTLYAQWQANTCTIFFDAGEGSLNTELQEAIYGSQLTEFPVPSRIGYDFLGWYDQAGNRYSEAQKILSGKTAFHSENYPFEGESVYLIARYERSRRKITFDYNDGSYQTATLEFFYGDTPNPNAFPQKDTGSSVIKGWSTSPTVLSEYQGTLTEDVVLYAIWSDYKTVNFYTIPQGQSQAVRIYRDSPYETASPERNGYRFDGWYTSSNYSGNPYSTITYATANLYQTFYAKWEAIRYSIAYNTNGAGNLPNDSYTAENEFPLPTVQKANFTFLGWCTDENLSDEPISALRQGSFGNIQLYAKYKGDDKTAVLRAEEGSLSISSKTVEYGAPFEIPAPVRDGYKFLGWFTAGNEQLTDSDGVGIDVWKIADNECELFAQYAKKYYVNAECSISGAVNLNVKEYYLAGEEVSLAAILSIGYIFDGYFDGGNLLSYNPNYSFEMPPENVDITVAVSPISVTVHLSAKGGFVKSDSVQIRYGESFDLPVVLKSGHRFGGWQCSHTQLNDEELKYYTAITNGNILMTSASGASILPSGLLHDVTFEAVLGEDSSMTDVYVFDSATLAAMSVAPDKTYVMVSDIDMAGVSWTPFALTGTFDGNGYSVKNLTVSSSAGKVGMFTTVSGIVKNLTLENLSITSLSYSSVLVGGVCAELTGTLNGVTVAGGSISGDAGRIGGLVGKNTSGIISDCVNRASVKSTSAAEGDHSAGGIAAWHAGGTITDCINYGSVSKDYYAGGVIGYASAVSFGALENQGVVTGKFDVGGVIGLIVPSGNATLTALTNSGAVTGQTNVGGVFGRLYGAINDYLTPTVTISRLTNTGTVTGGKYTGGIGGYLYTNNSSYGNCILTIAGIENSADVTGTSYVGGLFGYARSDVTSSKISSSSSSGAISAEFYVGGIAGCLEAVQLESCSNAGSSLTVTAYVVSGTDYFAYAGGYVGYGYTLANCVNNVQISYDSIGGCVGGIVGYAYGNVTGCENTANIYAPKSSSVGGVIGTIAPSGNATLTALTNSGAVTGQTNVGGVFGRLYGAINDYLTPTVTISRLTNTGTVTGGKYTGGIGGYLYTNNSSYGNCILTIAGIENSADVTGTSYVGGLFGYARSDSSESAIADYTVTGETRGTEGNVGDLFGEVINIIIRE